MKSDNHFTVKQDIYIFGLNHLTVEHQMSERETCHDSPADREGESDGEEVVFRGDAPRVESSTPPTHNMVSANDLDVVIEGWERKFQHLFESI